MKKTHTILFSSSPTERNFRYSNSESYISNKNMRYRHIVRGRSNRVISNPLYLSVPELFCNSNDNLAIGDTLLFCGNEYEVSYVGDWVLDSRDIEIQMNYSYNEDIPDYELHCVWLKSYVAKEIKKNIRKQLRAKKLEEMNSQQKEKEHIEKHFSSAIDSLEL